MLFGLDGEALEAVSRDCGGVAVEGDVTRTRRYCARRLQPAAEFSTSSSTPRALIAFDAPARIADETWRRVFAVNVDGPMAVCRAALPLLIAARGCDRQRRVGRRLQRIAEHGELCRQ